MGASASFKFSRGDFQNPEKLVKKVDRALYAIGRRQEGRIETWMKHNAPWRDRTTNARNGLFAFTAQIAGAFGGFAIYLVHSVTYGIYLELGTRYMRKRPVIVPALEKFGPETMRLTNKLMDRL